MPSMPLQISSLIILLLVACSHPEISIRKQPYPFLGALAISSDCDRTDDVGEFLTLMRFLNTRDATSIGAGLDLEVGYSFWFFDALNSTDFTIFIDTSFKLSPAESVIRDFIRAGYIDYLHTYGEFSLGGFRREFAESAVSYLKRHQLRILTWINHGPPSNCENVGSLSFQLGDNPDSPCYHLDLLEKEGFIFFDFYQITHIVGQDRPPGPTDILKGLKDAAIYLVRLKTLNFMDYIKNHLIKPHTFDDGFKAFSFIRFISKWGEVERANANNLYLQIRPQIVKELEENHGFMVIYTHLGDNEGPPEYFNDSTKSALTYLSNEFHKGRLLVTTTTRLLKLNMAVKNLLWETETKNDSIFIKIMGIKGLNHPGQDFYQGLTFYTPDPERTVVMVNGKRIKVNINPPDESGKSSVSIPWKRLKFPEKYRISLSR